MIGIPLRAALAALLLAMPAAAAGQERAQPVTLRVLTYNIRHGEGRDRRLDLERTARVIAAARPDLVALQEVDRWTERAEGVDQAAELGRLLGMHFAFGKTIELPGGDYGVAVLSRWPLLEQVSRPLPWSPDHERRAALSVLVRAGEGGPVVRLTSTHLDNGRDTGNRAAQARALNEALAADDHTPGILAGDFNARMDTEVMQILGGAWTTALPAQPQAATDERGRGRRRGPRGDFVLYRPAGKWRVVESITIDESTASDHRPVLTVLEWLGND